jgi:ATP-dependent RNA helicase RhlE
MNGVDLLVATPGRLIDLVRSNALRLSDVEILVLDEADRMLDMGFIHDIRTIVAKLPSARQTLFFSATMPQEIAQLAQQMLRDPARVAVTPPASTAELVEQRIIHVDRAAKPSILADVLKAETIDRALVFTRTKHGADRVVRGLAKAGITAEAIHGNKSQGQRERVLAAFRKGDVRTLVATDIAARGIDVDGISHVVNYDLPNIAETYVHRIGRTARAGATGVAISLCDAEETAFLRDIEKLIRTAIPATDRRTGTPRPIHTQSDGARSRSQPNRGRGNGNGHGRGHGQGHGHGNGHGQSHGAGAAPKQAHGQPHGRQPDRQRQAQPQRHPQPERHPEDLTGVVFLNRAAKARRDDGRRPQR